MSYDNCSIVSVLESEDFSEANYFPPRYSDGGMIRIITGSRGHLEKYLREVIRNKVMEDGGRVKVYTNEGGFLDLGRSPIIDRSSRFLKYLGKFDFFQFGKSPLLKLVRSVFSE